MPRRGKVVKEGDTGAIPVQRVVVADASSLIYKDRSGPPLKWGLTEGKDNFAAVTAEAIKSVELAK